MRSARAHPGRTATNRHRHAIDRTLAAPHCNRCHCPQLDAYARAPGASNLDAERNAQPRTGGCRHVDAKPNEHAGANAHAHIDAGAYGNTYTGAYAHADASCRHPHVDADTHSP